MQHKKCTKCGGFKPLTDFYKSKRGMDGRRSDCKLCSLIYMKDRYCNEPGVKERMVAASKKSKICLKQINPKREITKTLINHARARAKKNGLPFNITIDDISFGETCPVLGIPFVFGKDKPSHQSPTLDKLIPTRGYVRGNVCVISHRANWIKNNATLGELKKLVAWMESL